MTDASNQRGPRLGWTLGGLGGFLWIPLLGVVRAVQGDVVGLVVCLLLFGLGVAYLVVLAPWKHPDTPFWKLYSGLVVIMLAAAAVLLYRWVPDLEPSIGQVRYGFVILPLFLPAFIHGRKTWRDIHNPDDQSESTEPPRS